MQLLNNSDRKKRDAGTEKKKFGIACHGYQAVV